MSFAALTKTYAPLGELRRNPIDRCPWAPSCSRAIGAAATEGRRARPGPSCESSGAPRAPRRRRCRRVLALRPLTRRGGRQRGGRAASWPIDSAAAVSSSATWRPVKTARGVIQRPCRLGRIHSCNNARQYHSDEKLSELRDAVCLSLMTKCHIMLLSSFCAVAS